MLMPLRQRRHRLLKQLASESPYSRDERVATAKRRKTPELRNVTNIAHGRGSHVLSCVFFVLQSPLSYMAM